jgi:hypothetical protein
VTGSFALAGAHLVTHEPAIVVKVVGIPVFFLAGVVTTAMVRGAERRGRHALPAALALEALLLTGLLVAWLADGPWQGPTRRPSGPRACPGSPPWMCRAHWFGFWCRARAHGICSD